MDKREVVRLLQRIELYYPNRFYVEDKAATLEAWLDVLQDEEAEPVMDALKAHVRESHFPPNISDLLKRKPAEHKTVVPGVDETAAYLQQYEERKEADPISEEELDKIKRNIRKMLGEGGA